MNGSSDIITTYANLLLAGNSLMRTEQLFEALQSMSYVWAVMLLATGLASALQGYRHHRALVLAMAIGMGAIVGYGLGEKVQAAYLIAGGISLLAAVFCVKHLRFTVVAIGGLVGAFAGGNLWAAGASLIQEPGAAEFFYNLYPIGCILGLLALGPIAFVLYRPAIVVFTSISGSSLIVLGVLALLLQVQPAREHVYSQCVANPMLLILLITTGTCVSILVQYLYQKPANPQAASAAA